MWEPGAAGNAEQHLPLRMIGKRAQRHRVAIETAGREKQEGRPMAELLRKEERQTNKQRLGKRDRETETSPHHSVIGSHKRLGAFAVCEVGGKASHPALSCSQEIVQSPFTDTPGAPATDILQGYRGV